MKNVVGITRGDDTIIQERGIDVIVLEAVMTTNEGGVIVPASRSPARRRHDSKDDGHKGSEGEDGGESQSRQREDHDNDRHHRNTRHDENEGIERSIIDETEMIDTKQTKAQGKETTQSEQES